MRSCRQLPWGSSETIYVGTQKNPAPVTMRGSGLGQTLSRAPIVPAREHSCYGRLMKRRFFNSVEAIGEAVREARREQGLTQGGLASKARVGRRFIVDLEAGHLRAELGKVLAVLEALDIHAVALPSVRPSQRLDDIDLAKEMKRFD